MLTTLGGHLGDIDALALFQESREVSDHIPAYIAYKSKKFCAECCDSELISKDTPYSEGEYVSVLSRSDLLIPALGLSDAVTRGFALMGANTNVIRRSKVPSRKAGHSILKKFLNGVLLGYEAHESKIVCIISLPNKLSVQQSNKTCKKCCGEGFSCRF